MGDKMTLVTMIECSSVKSLVGPLAYKTVLAPYLAGADYRTQSHRARVSKQPIDHYLVCILPPGPSPSA